MKRFMTSLTAVAVAFTMVFATSIKAYATTYSDIEPWNASGVYCIDDPSNSTTSGTVQQIWNGCPAGTWLTGAKWTTVRSSYENTTGDYLELQLQNGMCLDNRGSTTNGSTYVIKSCNGSASQAFDECMNPDSEPEFIQPNYDLVWLPNPNSYSAGDHIVVYNDNGLTATANNRLEAQWWMVNVGEMATHPSWYTEYYPACGG
jgi:hypothetical protein